MTAPSTGHPVAITLGVAWTIKLDPGQPTHPRLTVAATIELAALTLARVIFGVVYRTDCPQQPKIPNYLLGLALITLTASRWFIFPCDRSQPRPATPSCLQNSLKCFMSLCWIYLMVAGDVWIFSVYQPNYDPTAADGLYCNKTLYTFAFWNAIWESMKFAFLLAKFCQGLLCCVLLQEPPAAAERDFYRNV
ncbi:uncharacterized protein LOC115376493 isoform X1 [Myripristis murdjan]|uniref:uncharacterized protein LOC115376493 isoform X1 n=1 Tax=Myripristis murdjan TaxID=586833 RepID=UPI00117648FD|nr:uncharacterized protein LOC115376493 isoform X1 [Myripristis murdjan]XP_029931967.1 uncharacterized protein LOC115376493 isoform X1 [Myripristis murdjan]